MQGHYIRLGDQLRSSVYFITRKFSKLSFTHRRQEDVAAQWLAHSPAGRVATGPHWGRIELLAWAPRFTQSKLGTRFYTRYS